MTLEGFQPRSLLYVPATRPEWIPKAWDSGADAVILDLEDSVSVDRKSEAREYARRALAEVAAASTRPGQLWVRINSAEAEAEADLTAVVGPGLTGVIVPKSEPDSLDAVVSLLDELEASASTQAGQTRVTALIETALGVQKVAEIATVNRVSRLALGEADLAGALGMAPDERGTELYPVRLAVILASAAAGIARPVGPVHTRIGDKSGLVATCLEQVRQGFRARTAVHPSQVSTINFAFTPSSDEIQAARETIRLFEAAYEAGTGAVLAPNGKLLDLATIRSAREVLSRSIPCGEG